MTRDEGDRERGKLAVYDMFGIQARVLAEDQAQLAQERIAEHVRIEEVLVAEQLQLLDFINIHIHIHIHTYIHTYVCAHIHTYAHTCICSCEGGACS